MCEDAALRSSPSPLSFVNFSFDAAHPSASGAGGLCARRYRRDGSGMTVRPLRPYLQRKIRRETAKGTRNHTSNIPTGTVSCPRLIPCSMFPRMASMAAVSGSARTSG